MTLYAPDLVRDGDHWNSFGHILQTWVVLFRPRHSLAWALEQKNSDFFPNLFAAMYTGVPHSLHATMDPVLRPGLGPVR